MPDDDPAVAEAEQVVRAYQDSILRAAMLHQVPEYKRELDGLGDDESADIRAIAVGSLKSQVDLYRQIWGEEPDLSAV
jgi:hypothetical protein